MKIIPSAIALATITASTLLAGSAWASPAPTTSSAPVVMPTPSPSMPTVGQPAAGQPAAPSSVKPSVGCALFPASPFCLLPLIRSLPACPQSMWVDNGSGWKCVPLTPPHTPRCDPPFTMPMLVNVTWVCLGGPGPEMPVSPVRPLPGQPHTMPMEPASPVQSPAIQGLVSAIRG